MLRQLFAIVMFTQLFFCYGFNLHVFEERLTVLQGLKDVV